MVTGAFQPARFARVPTVAQTFGNSRSAQAGLRGATGVYLNEFAPGALSLVRKHVQEISPSGIMYLFGQHSAGQSFDIQIFDNYCPVVANNLRRNFVMKVTALTLHMIVDALKRLYSFAAAIRVFIFAASEPPLGDAQFAFCTHKKARIIDCHAVRECSECCDPNIYPNRINAWTKWLRFTFRTEAHEPVPRFASDGCCLNSPVHGAVQFYFDFTASLNVKQPSLQSTTVSVDREGNRVIPTPRLKTREAWTLATSHPRIKSRKRFIQSAQNILAAAVISQNQAPIHAHSLELLSLIKVTDRFAASFPRAYALLKGAVIEIACLAQLARKEIRLCSGRIKTIFECFAHLRSLLQSCINEAANQLCHRSPRFSGKSIQVFLLGILDVDIHANLHSANIHQLELSINSQKRIIFPRLYRSHFEIKDQRLNDYGIV